MRLIDADKLLQYYQKNHAAYYHSVTSIHRLIQQQPTVDAAPVVHGKWKLLKNNSQSNFYMCSNCSYMVFSEWFLTDYCPSCGAKMDGGEKNDD
jgi:rubrerythrin